MFADVFERGQLGLSNSKDVMNRYFVSGGKNVTPKPSDEILGLVSPTIRWPRNQQDDCRKVQTESGDNV